VFSIAKDKAKSIIGEKAISALKEELTGSELELWLDNKIEQYVKISK
jgi:hypothetical protein